MIHRWRRFVVLLVVALSLAFGAWVRNRGPQGHDPSVTFRIATWNLRNFPKGHDVPRIARTVRQIDPDVLALQEIRDDDLLREALPEYAFHLTEAGGRGNQRLGVALRRERVRLEEPPREDHRLTQDGRLRPAHVSRIRTQHGDVVTIVVVHLKSSPAGAAARRAQWPVLRQLVAGAGAAVVLGDFNATGGPDEAAADERERLQTQLGGSGLTMVPVVGQCTAYWQGGRFDAWLEPTWLDMIWIRGAWSDTNVARAGSACGMSDCTPVRSTSAYPVADLESMSDHCPIWVDLMPVGRAL